MRNSFSGHVTAAYQTLHEDLQANIVGEIASRVGVPVLTHTYIVANICVDGLRFESKNRAELSLLSTPITRDNSWYWEG